MPSFGEILFALAPPLLAGWLLWRRPRTRHVRVRSVVLYLLFLAVVLYGTLLFVAHLATAQVPPREVLVVLWFAVTWRLLWEVWNTTIGRMGQSRVRLARRRKRLHVYRLIPLGRALLTATIFIPAFISVIFTHRFKLHDGQDPFSTLSARYEPIRIPTADGLTLDGWFIPGTTIPAKGPRASASSSGNFNTAPASQRANRAQPADRTILICHGAGANKGNFVWFLQPLLYRGYNVVFFDFRAHGSSDGRTCTYGLLEKRDVRAAVDWLKRERPAQSRTIIGLGSSQGAMALALAAADDPRIDAVILDSPFVSPRDLALYHARRVPIIGPLFVNLVLWEMSLQTGADFLHTSAQPAVAAIAPRPVLIIHGNEDAIMPVEHAQRLYNAARGRRELWLGSGPHSNIVTTDPAAYADHVFGFLK